MGEEDSITTICKVWKPSSNCLVITISKLHSSLLGIKKGDLIEAKIKKIKEETK